MKFKRIVVPPILGVLLCLVIPLVSQTRIFTKFSPFRTASDAPPAHSAGDRGPVRMIRFVLWDKGLYPRSMRVDQGLVNIAIEDKTNVSAGLAVERVVNSVQERVTTVDRVQNHWRGRELLRLTPGQYIVYDMSKPENKADLVVEP